MLKTVLESLDGVDDAVKNLYSEDDGKFILQLEGVDSHPDVANLKSAYERVKTDKATAIQERDALKAKVIDLPDDFDPEKWAKLKDGKADEAALIKLRQTLEAERDEWKGKAEDADAKLGKFAVDRDLSDALAAVGITDPALLKGARAMLSPLVKADDTGKAIVETDMGPLPLVDHVKKWAAGEGKSFVTPPKGGGRGGKDDGAGPKSWGEMTGTEKVALRRENPAEYDRLKAAAER